jgi:zinc/manganese transport system substrate-binding protein
MEELKMKHIIIFTFLLILPLSFAYPQIEVVTTYPYIANIVQQIGKENVRVIALARGDYNPHVIVPKPSYIAKVRNAKLLVINGAQLEIGWLPPILKQANNAAVQPGEKGFLDLSSYVHLIDVPKSVSRELGDVHPDGNPHFCLDPDNILIIATTLSMKLSELDPAHAPQFQKNTEEFTLHWKQKTELWEKQLRPLKGAQVIEYHKIFDYLLFRFGIQLAGTIEPLPGIPPTTKHIAELENRIRSENIKFILQDVYNPKDASKYLAQKTNVPLVMLPHDVNAVPEATSIESLFDEIVRRLTK